MNYFNSRKRAAEYIQMSVEYDGQEIAQVLFNHLKTGSTLLELGMGPGKDIPILGERYKVTGSDISTAFIDLYKEKDPGADILHLDAVSLKTQRKFDCIYSNKMIHHLTRQQLKQSLLRQHEILNDGGLVCHTLWYGDKEIEVKGMKMVYYNEITIKEYLADRFEVILARTYREMEMDDSILLIARKC